MIGIIYKFTIIAGYKIEGHKPYYVGQHWERNSLKHMKWITNGLENSRINESVELPIGWRYGRTRITN